MTIQRRVHVGVAEVSTLRDRWLALQSHPNPDFDHYLLVCNLRREVVAPCALSIERGNHLTGLVAGRIERAYRHPRIGYARLPAVASKELVVLHEGVMGEMNEESCEGIVSELLQTLDRGVADVVSIHHLPEKHTGLWMSLRRHPTRTLGVSRPAWTFHRALALETEPGFLLRKMRSKHRSWVKRKERELEEAFPGKVTWTWFRDISDLNGLCERMEQVARTTYQRGLGAGFIDNDETRQRLALFSNRGQMRTCLLECDGVPKAFWLGELYRGTFHSSATGYTLDVRPYEAGTLMFLRMVDELVREGASRLDFGLGDAEYKERFADESWREATVQLFASTVRGRALRAYLGLAGSIDAAARNLVRRMGILGRVKQTWRHIVRNKASDLPPVH